MECKIDMTLNLYKFLLNHVLQKFKRQKSIYYPVIIQWDVEYNKL